MLLLRPFIRSRIARTALSFRRTFKQSVDEPIDEQYHFIPMGKSDVSMQSRVSFISQDMASDKKICIQTVSSSGFRLRNGQFMYGPIAVFPKTVLSWRVPKADEITPEALELFFTLQPRLDILIVGVGNKENVDKVRRQIAPALKEHQLPYEILDSESAITTFNFLNYESRFVAAVLMPPENLEVTEYEHGKALSMVQDPMELPQSPLMMGIHNTYDDVEDVVNNTFINYSDQERKAILTRVRELRAKNVEKKIKYLEEIQEKYSSDERLEELVQTRRLYKEEMKKIEQIEGEKEAREKLLEKK